MGDGRRGTFTTGISMCDEAQSTVAGSVIAHIDLDAFFTSVEQLLNPRLAGKPVVVGGAANERGVVASASYEARARGVYVPMPLTRAYRVCPAAHFLRGRHEEYSKFSKRVFEICENESPTFQPASIDEGYLDWKKEQWSALHPHLEIPRHWPIDMATRLRDEVLRRVGLSVSVGLAKNRLVAKIASKYCKPRGICHVAAGSERAFLRPLALSVVPGIGKHAKAMLEATDLHTFDDVQRLSEGELESRVGAKWAGRLTRLANGEGSRTISLSGPPKSVSNETTFAQDCHDLQTVQSALYRMVEKASWRLRKAGLKAGTISVKLRTADFKTMERSRSIGYRTDQHQEVYACAQQLCREQLTQRTNAMFKGVRLIGVRLSNLDAASNRQLMLGDTPSEWESNQVVETVDQIRARFGFKKLLTAGGI
ncbi:MAG: DNA polymerase IV [Phycisphaerae bacterium]|nr:MAG: DNA polymerase IV [Phycisphaerae bacterium]